MRKDEVPQEAGRLDRWNEIKYALDENGKYVMVPSAGWEPSNVANAQAWEEVAAQTEAVLESVRAGDQSPLAFHMARHQMDLKLLAEYAGLYRWRVKRHLNPERFRRLKAQILERYARVFDISVEELVRTP